MCRVKILGLAGAAFLSASSAFAADLAPLAPPLETFAGRWYLRGDIGMSNQQVGSLYNVLYDAPGIFNVQNVGLSFGSAPIYGVGLGYQFNHWLRMDATIEYRGKAQFQGLDIVNYGQGVDEYHAYKSEWVGLFNVYADLGTWWNITPFIGVGVGGSYNRISSFIDVNTPNLGVAYAPTASKWNFAWAAYAGFAYHVTHNFTVELAYRYIDLGNAQSGDLVTYNGINLVNNPMEFRDITSHDLRLGVRWNFAAPPPPPDYPPLVTKG